MTLKQIIDIASSGYPGGCIALAHKSKAPVGDGLAEFLARELAETFEEGRSDLEQLNRAAEVVEKAKRELDDVAGAVNYAQVLAEAAEDQAAPF